ncbi:MAG: adenylate/guanylate cyclase domain-containing protein [Aromatoleum sp.]|uniref:adenylate/guanylate cyclase domain-containing protein n=1 Tax=Aromatoleum sp. TaxID=2307007 RepID=UPI0028956512|nr:adenylate/guanylate cyclase domain-containing protein [Aromatoleum sp.]MDT3672937.1 adenylate/guanylate cyclase domain-containing protein [Aromatoleum sp.]MDT3737247.1 adenylate/guanylate cyclase domain-containing protein [Denitratisoma sp.]
MNAKESAKIERNLCVLFADVSGSTRLYEKLGDKEALHAVERCLNRMTRATEQFKGRVIKTIGDEVMAVFDSAEAGMDAACSMQQRVDDLPPVSGIKLAIRIGFHFGPAIEDAKDVFGDTVNTAARMAGLAKAGQIITTGETVGALPTLLQQSTREIDALSVKGKAEDVRVCEVIWQESDDLTMKSGSVAPAPVAARLTVRHGGEEKVLDPGHGAFSLGRDAASDIMIADRRASRTHARIERRRDKFVLIDQSTNGTYVTFDGEAEFALKREEVILRGKGRISFGHACDATSEVVEFRVG